MKFKALEVPMSDIKLWGAMDRGRSFIISEEHDHGLILYWGSYKDDPKEVAQFYGPFSSREAAEAATEEHRKVLS